MQYDLILILLVVCSSASADQEKNGYKILHKLYILYSI